MVRLTLAQMRRSIGRLTAAGIAIVLGTAFVTATLLVGNIISTTTTDSIAAQFARSDLVVSADESFTVDDVEAARSVPGVDAADATSLSSFELSAGSRRTYQIVVPTPTDDRFQPQEVVAGAMPADSGEIALPEALAERFDVTPGDTVRLARFVWEPGPAGQEDALAEWTDVTEDLTLVGTLRDPFGAYAKMGGAAVVSASDLQAWAEQSDPESPGPTYGAIMVAVDTSAGLEQTRAELEAALPGAQALTADEYAVQQAASLTGDEDVFTKVILGFAGIALLVAALVIANTFQVLVAQRTRMLALLRCVGANRAQLARSVLFEATVLGVLSSIGGIVLGAGLTQIALVVLGGMDLGIPLPSTVQITAGIVLVPLLVGTAVTVLASLAPARAATRVAPLAALRPGDAPTLSSGAGRVRLVLASLLVVSGALLLTGGIVLGGNGNAEVGILVGVLGGALSFVGVLLGAIFWLPKVVSLVGRLVAGSGSTARLATANTLRNPRRTAATSTALLIGVTLVAMMSTGAASARTSLDSELDDRYPVDVSVTTDQYDEYGNGVSDEIPAAMLAGMRSAAGVRDVTELTATRTTVPATDGDYEVLVRGVDPQSATGLVRSPDLLAGLDDGTVVIPRTESEWLGIADGDTLTIDGPTGSVERTVSVTDMPGQAFIVSTSTMAELDDAAVVTRVWLGLEDVTDAASIVPGLQDTLSESTVPVEVVGAAVERAMFQQVVDTVLAVIVGLLGVAVVIALIGVANTLSLSVIERRRESATLRAIGLSRGQLRSMLAIEGMLIAGVGALLGVALGLLYGWAGSATALSAMGDVSLAVPWRDIAIVLVVALVAGLLASIVPGRAAARTSPVAALAVD
ncbi:ABC transporter permease [Oerskovia flava]|uniref:ABC transporter permease n=1 Tax=Oerskovia flava TaxID=2986422 RepID=UPI00224016F0|nr:ABC transporter permease [Oerskovia sp. JB1-3-2]